MAYLYTKAEENIFVFNGKGIYMNSFAYVLASQNFHKTSEGPNCLIKENQCKNNTFGQHASNGPNIRRNFTSKGDIDFSVTKFRFCDKYKKVATNTSDGNRVFSVSDKFSEHDISLTPGKSFGYPKQMYATYSINKDHNYGINQTPKKTLIDSSGSASRVNSVQVLATTTNSRSERNKFSSNQNKIKPAFNGSVEVVEGEFTFSEWQTTENRYATINYPNRCFQKRVGGMGGRGRGQSVREPPQGGFGHIRKGQNTAMYWSSLQ